MRSQRWQTYRSNKKNAAGNQKPDCVNTAPIDIELTLGKLIQFRCECGYLFGIREQGIIDVKRGVWRNVFCTKCGKSLDSSIKEIENL